MRWVLLACLFFKMLIGKSPFAFVKIPHPPPAVYLVLVVMLCHRGVSRCSFGESSQCLLSSTDPFVQRFALVLLRACGTRGFYRVLLMRILFFASGVELVQVWLDLNGSLFDSV